MTNHPTDQSEIPAGMVRWDGDGAPTDYDGGPALMRNRKTVKRVYDWGHYGPAVADGNSDIIAYTPRAPEVSAARPVGEVERLREALEPFAACCEQIADSESDEEWARFRLLIGDYRRARAALQEPTR